MLVELDLHLNVFPRQIHLDDGRKRCGIDSKWTCGQEDCVERSCVAMAIVGSRSLRSARENRLFVSKKLRNCVVIG